MEETWTQLTHRQLRAKRRIHILSYDNTCIWKSPVSFCAQDLSLSPGMIDLCSPHISVFFFFFLNLCAKANLLCHLLWGRYLFVVHQISILMLSRSSTYKTKYTCIVNLPKGLLLHSFVTHIHRSLHLFVMILCQKKATTRLVALVHSKLPGVVVLIQLTQCHPWGSHHDCCYHWFFFHQLFSFPTTGRDVGKNKT